MGSTNIGEILSHSPCFDMRTHARTRTRTHTTQVRGICLVTTSSTGTRADDRFQEAFHLLAVPLLDCGADPAARRPSHTPGANFDRKNALWACHCPSGWHQTSPRFSAMPLHCIPKECSLMNLGSEESRFIIQVGIHVQPLLRWFPIQHPNHIEIWDGPLHCALSTANCCHLFG